jgi:asparagine synthase (glutamine-hydrolysing)
MIDLVERRPVNPAILRAMAGALVHRGPDEDGFLERPGLGLASRRLSIVGLTDGRQPIANEDGSIHVVFNGELFDYPEMRQELEGRGHRFHTHTDTELLPHLWEEQGEGMLEKLRGQFALALWDERKQLLVLARDRAGICPLYWARRDGWLLFASEIKALLATGMVEAKVDVRGIDDLFTFMSQPGPTTCFVGVQALLPAQQLRVQRGAVGESATVSDNFYWEPHFPDRGSEGRRGAKPAELIDELEALLLSAVKRRLRADVPVAVCLSGGVDSSLVTAMAQRISGKPLAAFSVHVDEPGHNEAGPMAVAARHLGLEPRALRCGRGEMLRGYPDMIRAAEAPVVETTCAAVLLLSRLMHEEGYKVALTGQGADESLAGYIWFKVAKLLSPLDVIPGVRGRDWAQWAFSRAILPYFPWSWVDRVHRAVGGWNAFLDCFSLTWIARFYFFSRELFATLGDRLPHGELGLNAERMRRWHPLNRGLCYGSRTLLSGMLLSAKGDLASMASSVELRHPFLDEEVNRFCAQAPLWAKLRRFTDKYLLRKVAERWLPPEVAWRTKTMFLAPNDTFLAGADRPAWVEQLLSEESLKRTGYFDPEAVRVWRERCPKLGRMTFRRAAGELGLTGVISTQLWHHTFIDGSLADLPSLAKQGRAEPHGPVGSANRR